MVHSAAKHGDARLTKTVFSDREGIFLEILSRIQKSKV